MIQAVIFDMDGLLIDSEPIWRAAEVEVFNKIGVPLSLEMAPQTTGMRIDELVNYWHQRYPWETPSKDEVGKQIIKKVIERVKHAGKPKAGVAHAIAVCDRLHLPMAIASSSPTVLIEAVVERLGIGKYLRLVHSAEFEPYGKPHPSVYISAAQKMGFAPQNCLAFEDSINGVIAAKAAKMSCIAVPDPELKGDKRYAIADDTIDSLENLTATMIGGI